MTLRVSGKNMDVGDALRSKAEGHFDSVVKKDFDGGYTGVPRFDWELRRALPELCSINTKPHWRAWLKLIAWRELEDVEPAVELRRVDVAVPVVRAQ